MKVIYDQETDTVQVIFADSKVFESEENKSGVIIDYDKKGNVVGLEILKASKRIEKPYGVEYFFQTENRIQKKRAVNE